MTRHVFIIPEPHIWDKSFKNRVNYPQEIYSYLDEVISLLRPFETDELFIIFPGDIFHRSFTSIGGLIKAFNLFSEFDKISNSHIYSCVGNHELTYPFSNPFWMMAKDTTERYKDMQHLEAYGSIKHGINIVDDLTIGNLKFIFGHYGRRDLADDSKQDLVLISHNSIIEKEVCTYLQDTMGRAVNAEYMQTQPMRSKESIPISSRLKYVFVGHMHTFYSSFLVDETINGVPMNFQIQYLGSLGRTSINEVNDTDLTRTIPHFVITGDGSYVYSPLEMRLKPRAEVVIEEVVAANKKEYSREKAVKELRDANVFGESAKDAILNNLQTFPVHLDIFRQIYTNQLSPDILTLLQEAQSL